MKDAMSFKSSYLRCGMPFFKDALTYPAPENDDYKMRKGLLNEFFPFDYPCKNTRWTTQDKVSLITGVKKQMVDYIKIQQSQKVCQESKTRGKFQKLRFISSNQDLNKMSMADLCDTIQKDHPNFAVNWNLISFNDIQSNHSVAECMGMWYSYLKPDINREPFSDEENAILSHVVVEHKYQNWEDIAASLDRRTALQTFVHFFSSSSRLCPPNIRWTTFEDQKLLDAVKNSTVGGTVNWAKVGVSLEGRNRTQCYNRYLILTRYNSIKKGVFSPSENRILLDYVAKYGSNFNKMPKQLLPQRSIVQIKNHYNVALKHKGKVNQWTYEEDKILMKFFEDEGANWSKLAGILKTHNRLSCRTRHLTISKFLANNPDKTLKDVPSRLKTITAVHRAIDEDDDIEADDKVVRSKAFGLQTFEEFRLKNNNLYSLLKTTYNYDLGAKDLKTIDVKKFLVLKFLLNISDDGMKKKQLQNFFTKNQITLLKSAFDTQLDAKLMMEINLTKEHTQFLMPPNLNTAIGLRAIAIKYKEDPLFENNGQFLPNEPCEEYKKELEKFQKLFFSLFYWTAMVSKIDKKELQEIHFVRNLKSTPKDIFQFLNQNKLDELKLQVEKPSDIEISEAKPPSKKIKLS